MLEMTLLVMLENDPPDKSIDLPGKYMSVLANAGKRPSPIHYDATSPLMGCNIPFITYAA